MDSNDTEILTGLKCFCPPEIVQKYNHKHNDAKNWSRFYYYRDKKKTLVTNNNIDYDYEVTSTLSYNKNVFYKMTTMSMDDNFFDYYFKLKSDLPKCIVKKSNRFNSKKKRNINIRKFDIDDYETEDGKFILRFD